MHEERVNMGLSVFWVLFSIVATLCGVLLTLWFALTKPKLQHTGCKVLKGPKGFPFIGSLHKLNHPGGPFAAFSELAEVYGDIYKIQLGSAKCVVVSNFHMMKEVLLNRGIQFGGRPDFMRFHELFGGDRNNSLALCDWSDVQQERRRIAYKYCSPRDQEFAKMGRVANRETIRLLDALNADTSILKGKSSVKPIILAALGNMFTEYMCSTRFDYSDTEFNLVVRIFDEIFWDINQGYAVDFMPWLKFFYVGHMSRLRTWASTIRKFILEKIIDPRRETEDFKNGITNDFTDALLFNLERGDIQLSWEHILFELEDFLGGHSAVGNLVMLVLSYASLNPKIQEKIQKECDELLAKKIKNGEEPFITLSDKGKMRYIEAVILETLRISSSPIVPHVAVCDSQIADYFIPKDTVVFLNNYALNVDSNLWTSPEAFVPERFLKEDCGKSIIFKPPRFIPFSTGKRVCVGQTLVQGFAFVIIAGLFSRFTFGKPENENIRSKLQPSCVAVHPDGINFTLTPRETAYGR